MLCVSCHSVYGELSARNLFLLGRKKPVSGKVKTVLWCKLPTLNVKVGSISHTFGSELYMIGGVFSSKV